MAQGWVINSAADTITFREAPANGAAIIVEEFAAAAYNATDVWAFGAWNPGYGYPTEVEFFSDRLIFANTPSQPQTLFMSKAGNYVNHGKSVPILDDDAIVQTINARQVNEIRELVPLGDLVVMTSSAEWQLTTGADEVVAPGKTGFKPQSYYGTSTLAAQVIGTTALFVQGRGFTVRDLGYQFTEDGYTGNDLTVFSSHLVEGYTIVDIAYQQVPFSCVWLVRSDGKLITITYLREQEVVGWALHETDGNVEAVCTVPEGNENAVYVVVKRTINNRVMRYVERLATRSLTDIRNAFFVDSGLTYDGRDKAGTQTVTGGTLWNETEELTLTASVSTWVGATDVGDQVNLKLGTSAIRVTITQYVSATVVKVIPIGTVPVVLRGVAAGWDLLRDTVAGLGHLEAKTVSVLADGSVQDQKVVTAGAITLDHPAAVVHVGLPYRSEIESLDINVPGNESVRDRPKLIPQVTLLVKETRGLKAGPDLNRLDELKQREYEDYNEATNLLSGLAEFLIGTDHNKEARIVAVQDDPLPATILSLVPHVMIGGG